MLKSFLVTSCLALCAACSKDANQTLAPMRDAGMHAAMDAGTDAAAAAPYDLPLFDEVRISSSDKDPHFQQAEVEVDFGTGPFASATLIADLTSTCFPFEQAKDDPPPEGHHYPPQCDAFDRNFEFTLDEPKQADDPPALELVRAITPFGGPLHIEQDLTDLANGLPGKHRIKVFIATWSDAAGLVSGSHGGWNVSAHLAMAPGKAPRPVLAVAPLANTSLTSAQATLDASFTIPKGTRSLHLELRSTGHGGGTSSDCFGPAEEFCKRRHTVHVDGKRLGEFDLTRYDCASLCTLTAGPGDSMYCKENPTGAPESVRAPRAGWCPGAVSPPRSWDLEVSAPNDSEHRFSYGIDNIAEGGSYRVSAVAYALGMSVD